jgi:hypothetical protein
LPLTRVGVSLASEEVRRGAVCRLTDDNPVDGGEGLEPRGGVHRVAGYQVVAVPVGGNDQDGSRVDPDAGVKVEAQDGDTLEDPQRRPDGPLGVVLVGGPGPEEGHDPVAEEPIDKAAVPCDLVCQDVVVREKEGMNILGIQGLAAGGESREVGEQDGNGLAFLARGDRDGGKGHCARATEPEAIRVRGAAGRAGRHALEHRAERSSGEGDVPVWITTRIPTSER